MKGADQHNEIELNYVHEGGLVLQHGAETVSLTGGRTVIYWAAIPHQVISAEPRNEFCWVVFPVSWFLSWEIGARLRQHLLQGKPLMIPPADAMQSRMLQWGIDMRDGPAEMKKAVRLELEGFFLRLDHGFSQRKERQRPKRLPIEKHKHNHVQLMVRYMTEHSGEPIGVEDIVRATGLRPEYAMRLFKKSWGMTLWDFLLRHRISNAQRLLMLTDLKVVDIGFECGFGSTSRFYEAFWKYCRCSPLVYRRRNLLPQSRGG